MGAAFDFKILSDTVREGGLRFVRCESTNGVIVNISGFPEGATFGSGDASLHEGLEHFGLDSENLEADIERLEAMGAKLLDGPNEGTGIRICFMKTTRRRTHRVDPAHRVASPPRFRI